MISNRRTSELLHSVAPAQAQKLLHSIALADFTLHYLHEVPDAGTHCRAKLTSAEPEMTRLTCAIILSLVFTGLASGALLRSTATTQTDLQTS